jgi:hypothetical protein
MDKQSTKVTQKTLLYFENIRMISINPEYWTPGPNSQASTCQVQPLAPICQIKCHGERQRKDIYYEVWDTSWEEAE